MSLHFRYRNLADDRWLELISSGDTRPDWLSRLTARLRDGVGGGARLPTLPGEQIQTNFVGSSGSKALREGFEFYRFIKSHCRQLGRPVLPSTRILDFGCGWGRIIRFFLKDVESRNLIGVDVDPEIIQVCRDTIPEAHFDAVNASPPTQLSAGSFDVIYAYSVFSHLQKDIHMQWVQEFARLLKPGGLVFATTQKRSFIEYCNGLAEDQLVTPWHRALATAFRPLDVALSRYDLGEFVFSPTGGGGVRDASFYGEAAVSEGYVDRHWPPYLTKLEFDQESLPQAVIVARKA